MTQDDIKDELTLIKMNLIRMCMIMEKILMMSGPKVDLDFPISPNTLPSFKEKPLRKLRKTRGNTNSKTSKASD